MTTWARRACTRLSRAWHAAAARRLPALLLVALLAACGEAPEPDRVKADLAGRLDAAFGAGAVEVAGLKPQGSAQSSASGEPGVVVFFRAELLLKGPLGSSDWERPGVASLASVLGAGPRGISGLRAEGNAAGDRISVFGTSAWLRDGTGWRSLAGSAPAAEAQPPLGNQAPASRSERLLEALNSAVLAAPRGTTPVAMGIVEQELAAALAAIETRMARARAGYAVATGPAGGEYARFGAALQATNRPDAPRFTAITTAGSVENLMLLSQGRVTLALVQADTAAAARAGAPPFDGDFDARSLRALLSLFPESLHVVVRSGQGIARIGDLAGRRVAVGRKGSGSATVLDPLLQAHGVAPASLGARLELDYAEALAALRSGDADALVQVIAAPSVELRSAFLADDLTLLPLDPAAIEALLARAPGFVRSAIPPGLYRGQDQAVPGIATPALLLADTRLTEPEVEELVRTLFARRDAMLAEGALTAAKLGAATARTGLTVPLHEGARRALEAMPAR